MTTTVFNLSAIDRIEADVKSIGLTQQLQALATTQAMQTEALAYLTKTLMDFISSLGGGDQSAIDVAVTKLQSLAQILNAVVTGDHSKEAKHGDN
jgi:hypothetical protein